MQNGQDVQDWFEHAPNAILWKQANTPEIQAMDGEWLPHAKGDYWRNKAGFVLHPFEGPTGFLEQASGYQIIASALKDLSTHINVPQSINREENKALYKKAAQMAIADIRQGKGEKVVLSRKENWQLKGPFPALSFFKELTQTYPSAFAYLAKLEDELWIGATPELLLRKRGKHYTTFSLAGTRHIKERSHKGPLWTDKEIQEQGLVTDYIVRRLYELGIDPISKEGPKAVQAGKLYHLKTQIDADADLPVDKIAQKLHPTPAVAGLPLDYSLNTLHELENHERSLYAGYLGPIRDNEGEADLYVNIRCMRVKGQTISFYAGAGLTSQSDAQMETEETSHKIDTLLQPLMKMVKQVL